MYFFGVIIRDNNILFKLFAKLLIVTSVLCVLFGNGAHVHTIFDHLSDHGDIHAYVHAHPSDITHDHKPGLNNDDAHQHPTATVDLTGTLTQKTTSRSSIDTDLFSASVFLGSHTIQQTLISLYLDLPPPDHLYHSNHFSPYSLRGPPLG